MLEGAERPALGAPPGGQLQTAITVASNVMWTAYRSTISGRQRQCAIPPADATRCARRRFHDWPVAGVQAKQLLRCALMSQPIILCRRGDAPGAGPHTRRLLPGERRQHGGGWGGWCVCVGGVLTLPAALSADRAGQRARLCAPHCTSPPPIASPQ
jgi:hypothetical protein